MNSLLGLPERQLKYLVYCRSGQDWRGFWQSGWHLAMEDPGHQRQF